MEAYIMKAFLIQYTTSGIRNINKNITLDFTDYGIPKKAHIGRTNVKGIYGMNGSGKTSILLSMKILKSLFGEKDFISSNKDLLERILNKKKPIFYGRLVFMIYDDHNDNHVEGTYSYEIQLEKKEGHFLLTHERFTKLLGRTINEVAHEKTIFETENGILKQYIGPDFEIVRERTLNLLSFFSFAHLEIPIIFKNISHEKDKNKQLPLLEESLFCLYFVFQSMAFSIEEGDLHRIPTIRELGDLSDSKSINDKFRIVARKILNEAFSPSKIAGGNILVAKKDFSLFQKEIEKLYRFLVLFKPSLKNIEIEKKIDKENYLCSLIFVYKDYCIDFDLESSGIKKLVGMFTTLKTCGKGGIAFIDEIDNCINDVYLEKLIEYFVTYGKGQLVFTSHNLYLMEKLKSNKHSIDFLNDDGDLVSWTLGGKMSPANQYRIGAIPENPMNIDPMDYLPIFGVESHEK